MNDTRPHRSTITTHIAAFLLGIVVGLAAHPCTTKPPPTADTEPHDQP